MTRLSLALLFIAGATAFIMPKIGILLGVQTPALLPLFFYVPAAVLGIVSWWSVPTFARSWPVVAAALLGCLGLFWAGETESRRGLLIAGMMCVVLPVGALVAKERLWWFCARVYVLANVAALGFVLWCQYVDYGGLSFSMMRVGSLRNAEGDGRITDPNFVGGQWALAAIIALILYVRGQGQRTVSSMPARPPEEFSLLWTAILSAGCLLTASRGAFLSWSAGISVVFFWSTRAMAPGRLRNLVAASVMGFAGLFFVSLSSENVPWTKLYERLAGQENSSLLTLGSRPRIWHSGIQTWWSDSSARLLGVGTGMADETVGQFDQAVAMRDQYGNVRRSCHSVYVEWLISYGIIGIAVGACLLVHMFHTAWRLDAPEGMANRLAILLTVLIFAATVDLFRRPDWTATGSLVLAMLSQVPGAPLNRFQRTSA